MSAFKIALVLAISAGIAIASFAVLKPANASQAQAAAARYTHVAPLRLAQACTQSQRDECSRERTQCQIANVPIVAAMPAEQAREDARHQQAMQQCDSNFNACLVTAGCRP